MPKKSSFTAALVLTALAAISRSAASSDAQRECPADEPATKSRGRGCTANLPSAHTTSSSSCSLYLAPSSLPDAGLGVYTAVPVEQGWNVGEPDDILIPLLDSFKTLPYRGQQQFVSWLGYVWPRQPGQFYHSTRDSFPTIPASLYQVEEGLNMADGLEFGILQDDGAADEFVGAFVPGMAVQANSHPDYANIEKNGDSEREEWGRMRNERDPGVGAFSPYVGVTFSAMEDISAGSELFLDYGELWHDSFEQKQNTLAEFETIEDWRAKIKDKELPTEQGKRSKLHNPDFGSHGGEFNASPKLRPDVESGEATTSTIKDVEWLKKEGVCMDNLQAGRSTKHHAGRGAFARNVLSNRSVIAPAPLLVLKRDDLVIYAADSTQNSFRDVLQFDRVEGQELLLNYCYGDPNSPLLLLPISPMVNYINHDGEEPNAMIRWPQSSSILGDAKTWLDLYPLDALEQSGKLMMEIVALRDIQPGEEIFIDYGRGWEDAWNTHMNELTGNNDELLAPFRHEIGAPDGFFPDVWKQKVVYEIAPRESPLKPGELEQLRWSHNGKPVSKSAFRVGLPAGFSQRFRAFSDERGITKHYETLLNQDILESDEWNVFDDTSGEKWFAHRYMSDAWNFNMHYVAAWDESARVSFLRAIGSAGFDVALESIGTHFGLDNMTCFHMSYMGVTECDNSFTHADLYASDEKSFNIIFPIMVVNGSKPELDIVSDDTNIAVSVNYEYDVAYVLTDWGYHKTSPNDYVDKGQMRIVVGVYCSQIDNTNAELLRHIYDGEDPAPFADQFELPFTEIHWGNGHSLPK